MRDMVSKTSIKDVAEYFELNYFNRANLLVAPKEYKKYLWETLWVFSCGVGEYENIGEVIEFEFQNGSIVITINKFNLSCLEVHENKAVLVLDTVIGLNKNGSVKLELFNE